MIYSEMVMQSTQWRNIWWIVWMCQLK